jgi:hypothetical protein
MNSALYSYNVVLILLLALFSFLNRSIKQQITEKSQVALVMINVYAFAIRIPIYVSGEASKQLDFSYAIFLVGLSAPAMYTIFGSLCMRIYYEVNGKKYIKDLLQRTKSKLKRARSKMKENATKNLLKYHSKMSLSHYRTSNSTEDVESSSDDNLSQTDSIKIDRKKRNRQKHTSIQASFKYWSKGSGLEVYIFISIRFRS